MVLCLSELLDVPMRDRNLFLLAVAPPTSRSRSRTPRWAWCWTLSRRCCGHDPNPALVVDGG
ncbi:hypothetical protein ACFYZB_14220 [Streptomyces sp. NPDC001852]|uniref:hypothetical protein n=1 Tax=Streptomyces sp. NPDC001852 TaxID=3364619 RepID=UPI0036772162